MIKKILLWTLYAAFVGLIIFGAIYRTNARLDGESPVRQSNQSQNEGNNRNQLGSNENNSSSESEPDSDDNEAYPDSTEGDSVATTSDSDGDDYAGESEHEWLTLTGVVTSVTTKNLVITLDDGQSLTIARRPWRFAQENGFTTSVGNQIELIGFYENDEFQAAQLHDLTTDLLVRLRDETGHPLWASG
jgi:hypothetical protein